jgi:hypothetical protein
MGLLRCIFAKPRTAAIFLDRGDAVQAIIAILHKQCRAIGHGGAGAVASGIGGGIIFYVDSIMRFFGEIITTRVF